MKKIIMFALALIVISMPVFAVDVNVLTNGDFSDGLTGWNVWNNWPAQYRNLMCLTLWDGQGMMGFGGVSGNDYNGVVYKQFDVAPSSTYSVNGQVVANDNSYKRYCEVYIINANGGFVAPAAGNDFSGNSGVAAYGDGTIVGIAKASGTDSTPTALKQLTPWNFTSLSQMIRWGTVPPTFTTTAGQTKATILFHCGSVTNGAGGAICDIKIDNFTVTGPAPLPPKHVYGLTNRAAAETIAVNASAIYDFKVWGKVTTINANSFTLDDGSGAVVTVNATGYTGIVTNDYASAVGTLSGSVLTSAAAKIRKLN